MWWKELSVECRKTLWRGSPIVDEIRGAVEDGRCGILRSLRFTWMRPRKKACSPEIFESELLAAAIDAAEYISGEKQEKLVIEKVPGANNIFALLRLGNDIVAEYEINEELPDTMQDIFFVKANFDVGCLTNQPLTGFFNTEGMIHADADSCSRLIMENPSRPPVEGPVGQMIQRRIDLFNGLDSN